jgi:dimethylargininase
MSRCELVHLERRPIDVSLAGAQHRQYEQTLRDLGCVVHSHPPAADLPDSVFVEDAAIVLEELAVIARPGAPSRRQETELVETALRSFRALERIEPPATLDGGDVLCVGRTVFVGVSGRTNGAGFEQMRARLRPHGYDVLEVPVEHCLHLKSAVTRIGEGTVLVNREWLDPARLRGIELIDVDPREPYAANALVVGETVICSKLFPRTRDRLVDSGISVVEVDVSELAKAEGGVTCCSIVFETAGG